MEEQKGKKYSEAKETERSQLCDRSTILWSVPARFVSDALWPWNWRLLDQKWKKGSMVGKECNLVRISKDGGGWMPSRAAIGVSVSDPGKSVWRMGQERLCVYFVSWAIMSFAPEFLIANEKTILDQTKKVRCVGTEMVRATIIHFLISPKQRTVIQREKSNLFPKKKVRRCQLYLIMEVGYGSNGSGHLGSFLFSQYTNCHAPPLWPRPHQDGVRSSWVRRGESCLNWEHIQEARKEEK